MTDEPSNQGMLPNEPQINFKAPAQQYKIGYPSTMRRAEANHSDGIGDLAAALALAQGAFEPISKSRVNPRFGSAYATLDDIISATRKALSANGLAIMQLTPRDGAETYVETLLAHSSGQWLSTHLPVMVGNITSREGKEVLTQAQAFGSALTYARRYALAALLNVAAEEDDDAESSGEKSEKQVPSPVSHGLCPVHKVPFLHRFGVTKAGKAYDFWACPEKEGGKYCAERPPAEIVPQPISPDIEKGPETPGAGKADTSGIVALGASEEWEKLAGPLGGGATPLQINAINVLAQKRGMSREKMVERLGKAPEDLTEKEAGNIIKVWS